MNWLRRYGLRRYGRIAAIVVVVAAGLASAPRPYGIHEKAFYADPKTVEFVAPGLNITITGASISSTGTITVNYTLTDPNGLPLDSNGVTTPGNIGLSFIAAVLPNGQEDYFSYTTRAAAATVSSPAMATTNQAGADSGGKATSTGNGYQYVFKTTAPSGFDPNATHTIGIYGSRNLTAYNLGTNYASATFNFVPSGSPVTHTHDIIKTASCNACHDQLSAHGGSRRGMDMCVLCHTPQTVDPNTGDTMDAKVFFHKVHMGANLPSVVAGGKYIPAINSHGTFDYSDVVFPADPEDPRRCTVCHAQAATGGAAQQTAYLTNPSRAACGSCHDDTNFATGENHPGGIQVDDSLCANCHIPQGQMDFDASITGAHVPPTSSSLLSGLNVKITNATGAAGGKPTLTFTLLDNGNNAIPLSKLSSLSAVLTGPTTDYGATNFGSDVTTPGYVSESMAKTANCSQSGNCTYTFTHAIPASATGTFAIGIEARRSETVPELIDGDTVQTGISYGAANPVAYFSVDGSPLATRRAVIAENNCNQCHVALSVHGGLRNNTEYCTFCHNPNGTDSPVRGSAKVAADKTQPPQGINFNLMVHRIHYGVNMPANRPYTVVGFGGSHNDFTNPADTASAVKATLFPAMSPTGSTTDTQNCSLCHVNGSEQNDLALTGLLPVTDPQGPLPTVQPFTSACTGCHVDIQTASHALSNTTQLGEACNVCHGTGGAYAVQQVHAQY